MAKPLLEIFSGNAQRLSRNPLGIIALFIVLVYGIAGLVLAMAAASLAASERLPLIWFLVVFPVFVLGSFLWLVACHHAKLYAPADYRDPEGFFRAMTPSEQWTKIKDEVSAIEDAFEAAPAHSVRTTSMASEYFVTEDLVVREIEEEFGVEVERHIGFGRTDISRKSTNLGFDGAFRAKDGRFFVLEVKYSPGLDFGARSDSLMHQIKELAQNFDRFLDAGKWQRMTYIFALVASKWSPEKMAAIKQQCAEIKLSKASLDVRFFELPKLQEKLGAKRQAARQAPE